MKKTDPDRFGRNEQCVESNASQTAGIQEMIPYKP